MKFLIVAQRFHTNLYYRVKALQDAGHSIKVVVLYKGKSEFYENIDIQVLKLSVLSRLLSVIINFFKKNYLKTNFELRTEMPGNELNKIFRTYKPDVILLKAYQNLLTIKTLYTAKKYKVKVLMLTQTPYNHIKGSKFLFKLNMKFFHFLRVYAYITPIKINYDVFKKSKIENIYYLPFVYPKVNIRKHVKNNNYVKIISVGKFVKRKDQLLLLKAVLKLINENYPVKLTLIGEIADEDYFQKIQQFITKNNLSENVNIKINISYDKMNKEYQKHDLFILSGYAEPAAYSIVEAMANGLAVISSDENGTNCYINKNGEIFKAGDIKYLYKQIKLFVEYPEVLQKMKNNSLLIHEKHHLPKQFYQKIIQIIKQTF